MVLMPSRLAIFRSSAQARQARPRREREMNMLRPYMASRVTMKISTCMYEMVTPVISSAPMTKLPGSRLGMALSLESCASRTSFCRKIDMPIAEMSGIRRLLPRSGR
ncbi:hypothetical protein D9M71_701020 [compost metagenome]